MDLNPHYILWQFLASCSGKKWSRIFWEIYTNEWTLSRKKMLRPKCNIVPANETTQIDFWFWWGNFRTKTALVPNQTGAKLLGQSWHWMAEILEMEKNFSRILDHAMRTASLRALKWAPTWCVSAEVWDPFYGQPLDQVWMWYESWSLSWGISSGGSF